MKCHNCGQEITSIPQHCGQDMIYNEELEQFECYMGKKCGYVALNELLCDKCREECSD